MDSRLQCQLVATFIAPDEVEDINRILIGWVRETLHSSRSVIGREW